MYLTPADSQRRRGEAMPGIPSWRGVLPNSLGQQGGLLWPIMAYPLVNIQKAIENDNFQWENPL